MRSRVERGKIIDRPLGMGTPVAGARETKSAALAHEYDAPEGAKYATILSASEELKILPPD